MQRNQRTKRKSKRNIVARPTAGSSRNASLDVLRGLAILLMIIDHIAYFIYDIPIAPTTIRILTRISMPLFCALMGYFLVSKTEINWHRFYQLCLATLAINLVFFTKLHKLEILASLLVCYAAYIALRNWLCLAVVAVYFSPLDPLAAWFDYPLPIVLSCVAQGMVLRQYGWRVASISGVVVTLGVLVVSSLAGLALYTILPATLLIAWASRYPRVDWAKFKIRWLETLGRYPLTAYLVQYFIVFAIGRQV